MEAVKVDRRRYLRWRVGEGLTGRIASKNEVSILDISLGGALIEHSNLVRPGTLSFLTLLLRGREVSLRYRVVRSGIYRYETWPTGEQEHLYRTGVEFLAVSEDSRRVLDKYINFLGKKVKTAVSA